MDTPSREEVLESLSVDQIKEAIESYGHSEFPSINVETREYSYGYSLDEFADHIKNANISEEDKLACLDLMKESIETRLLQKFDKEEINSPEFVQGYLQDVKDLRNAENKNRDAGRAYGAYSNIVRDATYLRECVFQQNSPESRLADKIVTDCIEAQSLEPFEELRRQNPQDFTDRRWELDFQKGLKGLITPEGLSKEDLIKHQALLKEYVSNPAGFEQGRADRLGDYSDANRALQALQSQQFEKYARFSEQQLEQMAHNPSSRFANTIEASTGRRPSIHPLVNDDVLCDTNATWFTMYQSIDGIKENVANAKENSGQAKPQLSLEQRLSELRGLGSKTSGPTKKTTVTPEIVRSNVSQVEK